MLHVRFAIGLLFYCPSNPENLAKYVQRAIQSLNNDSLMKEAVPALSNSSHSAPLKAIDVERLCDVSKSENLSKQPTKALEIEHSRGN